MSLLSYNQLCELVERGVITDVPHEHINGASIDVCLGNDILIERAGDRVVCLRDRHNLLMESYPIGAGGYRLDPGEFILAHTIEKFNLPNDIAAEFKLKSSVARIGCAHLLAGHCDPGWHGSVLTLELHNVTRHHSILLQRGDRIGQVIFHKVSPVPADRSYRALGRYNNDLSVSAPKRRANGEPQ